MHTTTNVGLRTAAVQALWASQQTPNQAMQPQDGGGLEAALGAVLATGPNAVCVVLDVFADVLEEVQAKDMVQVSREGGGALGHQHRTLQ